MTSLLERLALGDQLVALLLGVDRVADPAEQVAERLERAVAPSWIGPRTDSAPRWSGVQPARGGLAEVRRQQEQRERDEAGEDRTTASYLLVVHALRE